MKKNVRFLSLVLLFLLWHNLLLAGTTGKITGSVRDADSGDPLPGANVVIEGTMMGAASDLEGYFVIINVPIQLERSFIEEQVILIIFQSINSLLKHCYTTAIP